MYGVWIDREKVRIFREENGRFRQVIRFDANSSQLGLFHPGQENILFQQAAHELKRSRHILLLGPGMVKHHFRNYLMEQHPSTSRKIILSEEIDATLEIEVERILENYRSKKRLI